PYDIVGLVPDTKYNDLREPFQPIAFVSDAQVDRPQSYFEVVIRSRLPVATLAPSLTKGVTDVNPAAVIYTRTFQSLMRSLLTRERLLATLSGFFALLAATLAVIGLYGVMSYMVSRRTNEIGIRMALGADQRRVMRMILMEAVGVLGAGI